MKIGIWATVFAVCLTILGCESQPEPEVHTQFEAQIIPLPADKAVERGDRLAEQGLLESALTEFERAIEINPTMAVAYIGAGSVYRERGDFKESEDRFAKAAQLEPRNFDAQYGHGLALQLLDKISQAIRAYLRALTIRPNDFDANLNLATAFLQVGEPRQALPYARRAVRLDTQSGPARVNLGAVYAALTRHAEAIVEYQQAAELMDLSPQLLLNLAESLGKVGRYEEMRSTLDQLLRTAPSAVAYERLGSALFRLKQYEESEGAFRRAIQLDPRHYPALNGLAVCLLNQYLWSNKTDIGALDEAIDSMRRSLQIERRQPRIIELLTRYG